MKIQSSALVYVALIMSVSSAHAWDDPYLANVSRLSDETLRKMYESGDVPATVQLAKNLYQNSNPEQALEMLRAPAEAGIPSAQYLVGAFLRYCPTRCRDVKQGAQWLELSANSGHPVAQEILAGLYDGTFDYLPKDPQKAYQLYLAAAKQGLVHSQLNVGIMLCAGKGVPKDKNEGRKWLEMSQKGQKGPYSFRDAGC